MPSPKVLIIIPAYNEEKSIKHTLSLISKTSYDYVVINDGSTDKTPQILDELNCNHIDLIFNLGIGGAVQTGYKYAYEMGYNIAIQFDADGQHNIAYIKDLIEPIKTGSADLVIGSCFIDKKTKNKRSSTFRRFGIRFLSGVIHVFSGKRIYDPTSGFRAANQKVISLFSKNYPLEYPEPVSNYELLRSRNIKIKEIPVTMNKRIGGKSSINGKKVAYAGLNVLLSIISLSLERKHYD